ncbi:unnamed protein product [Rotaria sordida]|uniref:Uncharacterized protein n=1 Tax=Rotaria sordida TaxID=392033 RepID=A0A816AUA5_9BILA|nr:unnamed protein product [Rotaria sordida]CAF1600197.1 unnamed protein product [Rotaria sordida]
MSSPHIFQFDDRNRNSIIGRNWINALRLSETTLNYTVSNNTSSNINSSGIRYIRTTSKHSQSSSKAEHNVDITKSAPK